jgi:hypothetical protein
MSKLRYFAKNRDKAREAGRKGGLISRRKSNHKTGYLELAKAILNAEPMLDPRPKLKRGTQWDIKKP